MKDTYSVADIATGLGCSTDEVRKFLGPKISNPKEITSDNLASEIKARIYSMNINQQEFAKKIKVPKGSLSSILCGAWHFSPAVAEKIVDFFNKAGLSLNLSVEEVVKLSQQASQDYYAKKGQHPTATPKISKAPISSPEKDTVSEKKGERWFEFMEGEKHTIHFFPESAIQCISFAESFGDWTVVTVELKNGKKLEHRYDCDNKILASSYVQAEIELSKMLSDSNRLFNIGGGNTSTKGTRE